MFSNAFSGILFIPLNENELSSDIAGDIAYTPKVDSNTVKARQDYARQNGAYDPNTRSWNRTINGISENGTISSSTLD